jgi:hypothetical protein
MDNIAAIVKETIAETKRNSFGERIKSALLTLFFSAFGTLLTILVVSAWHTVETNSSDAKKEVLVLRALIDSNNTKQDAKNSVIISTLAKIETFQREKHADAVSSIPKFLLPEPPLEDTLHQFEEQKEMIHSQIETEIKRTGR